MSMYDYEERINYDSERDENNRDGSTCPNCKTGKISKGRYQGLPAWRCNNCHAYSLIKEKV